MRQGRELRSGGMNFLDDDEHHSILNHMAESDEIDETEAGEDVAIEE